MAINKKKKPAPKATKSTKVEKRTKKVYALIAICSTGDHRVRQVESMNESHISNAISDLENYDDDPYTFDHPDEDHAYVVEIEVELPPGKPKVEMRESANLKIKSVKVK